VAHEVAPEAAARLLDALVGGQLDEIRRLFLVEVVALDESELDGGCDHAFLEVLGVEREAVAEELDDVVLSGLVVHLAGHCL
jgi:hypothetical protein